MKLKLTSPFRFKSLKLNNIFGKFEFQRDLTVPCFIRKAEVRVKMSERSNSVFRESRNLGRPQELTKDGSDSISY